MSVNPPRHRMPPLNALRAFEAAARLGGISRAADELCVTPGAVAQQVKTLEDWVGAPLFARHAKGVALNDLGQRSLVDFEAAFDLLSDATQNLRIRAAPQMIRIAALPSLAQLWLSPRMPGLRARFPEARISISALEQPPNLAREGYDIAVFLEAEDDAKGEVLARDFIGPVCAPALAASIRTPKDLYDQLWLRDSRWQDDWPNWLAGVGFDGAILAQPVDFSLYALAVDEACNGAGLLMGHEILVARHVAAGDLVAPFGFTVATGKGLTARLRGGEKRFLPMQIVEALSGSDIADAVLAALN
jgi:LysR family transcriptional regulator, glycine cleavage system transcriptional activator